MTTQDANDAPKTPMMPPKTPTEPPDPPDLEHLAIAQGPVGEDDAVVELIEGPPALGRLVPVA